MAGKQAGGDKDSGTRSSLMYETIRIVEKLKPKYVIWENVKNLLSTKHKHNFDAYLTTMEQLGYENHYKVLNAKDYGVPQNRERVFTVSILKDSNFKFPKGNIKECEVINPLKDISGKSWQFEQNVYSEDSILRSLKAGGGSGNIPKVIEGFKFPPKQELKLKLKDILEDKVDEKYYLSNKAIQGRLNTHYEKYKLEENIVNNKEIHPTILARFEGAPTLVKEDNKNLKEQLCDILIENNMVEVCEERIDEGLRFFKDNVCGTIRTSQAGGNKRVIENVTAVAQRGRENGQQIEISNREYANAITTVQKDSMVNEQLRIRKLTPKECWRLMGFTDEQFEKAEKVNSNAQLYKEAGNSIVVNVLMEIFKNLLGDEYYDREG